MSSLLINATWLAVLDRGCLMAVPVITLIASDCREVITWNPNDAVVLDTQWDEQNLPLGNAATTYRIINLLEDEGYQI